MKNIREQLFLILTACVACAAIVTSFIQAITPKVAANSFPLHRLAEPFVPLKTVFANQPVAGYLTDKNLDETPVIARYELGQFTLAPTVLLLNHSTSPLVLIDASTPQTAMQMIKDNKLTPVKADNTGLILTVNQKLANTP